MGPGSGHLHPSPAGQAHTGAASRWACGAAPGHDKPPLHPAAPPCHRPGIPVAQLQSFVCKELCWDWSRAREERRRCREIPLGLVWSCSMGQVMTAQPTVLSSICQVVDSDHSCAACGQSLGEVVPSSPLTAMGNAMQAARPAPGVPIGACPVFSALLTPAKLVHVHAAKPHSLHAQPSQRCGLYLCRR